MKSASTEKGIVPIWTGERTKPDSARRYGLLLGGALCLFAMTLAAYGPAMRAGYIWDDDKYVTQNPLLVAQDGFWRIWLTQEAPSQYFPMVYSTFRIEYDLWGLEPSGYHITNIVIHAFNALLLWCLLRRLGLPGAWVAAAIFALHPVQVESVAWITERKNVLLAFFAFLSLLAWLKFAEASHRSRRAWSLYLISLFLYVLALFSKSTACTLPAGLVLILWMRGIPLSAKRWLQIFPYVLFGLAMGLLTMWWEEHHQGTDPTLLGLGAVDRLLIATRALWFYLSKLVWPVNLTFSYPYWNIDAYDPVQYLWGMLCILAALCLWYGRRRLGRGFVAAVAFYVATLLPMLGFFSLYTFFYSYVADHYQYVASVGPIALATALGCHGLNRRSPWIRRSTALLAALLLALLGTLTWNQCRIYKDGETLWLDTIKKNPGSWMAHNNLGLEYKSKGRWEKALQHFHAALAIKPDHARAHLNLGTLLQSQQRSEEAIFHFHQALNIKPDFAKAHNNLGAALLSQGKVEEGITHCREALRLDPSYWEAHYNLGLYLKDQNRHAEAAQHLREVLFLRPGFWLAYIDLGNLLQAQGKLAEAMDLYGRALRIKPGGLKAHYHLGRALIQQGRYRQAVPHFKEALKGRPDWPEALDFLAMALAGNGEYAEAMEAAEKALNLAEARGMQALVEAIKDRLALYREGKPYPGPLPGEAWGGQ